MTEFIHLHWIYNCLFVLIFFNKNNDIFFNNSKCCHPVFGSANERDPFILTGDSIGGTGVVTNIKMYPQSRYRNDVVAVKNVNELK